MDDVAAPGTADFPMSGHQALSDALLDKKLDNMAAAAIVVDDAGLIVAANSAAQSLLDRDAMDLIGQDSHDLLHRDQHGHPMPRTRCQMRKALLTRRTRHGDAEWFARGDGTLVQLSWLVTPYTPDSGVTGALALLYERQEEDSHQSEDGYSAPLTELDRLTLLAETTTQLTSTLDVDEALHRLAALTVPRLADWAVFDLLTEHDEVRRVLVMHHKDGILVERDDLQGPMPPVPEESPMPLSRALRGAASALAGPATYQGPPDSGIAVEQQRLFTETGMHSAVIAPIRGLRDVLGALTLGRAQRHDAFTPADLPLLEDLTRRAGLALDNARLYQRQRKVAETMQRHLLPQLPTLPGLQMTARYVPAPDASSVGGDWYDAFALAAHTHALAIGDVVGHDLDAAAGMAQVRNMLRAFAWSRPEAAPSAVVTRLDEAVMHIAEVPMATMILARLTLGDDALWRLRWTNAGHPPPLLVTHDGQARYLDEAHGMLLGTGVNRPRPDAVAVLPPQATLLLYTDGLIESPQHSLDRGLDRLRRHAASLAHRPLGSFCDALLEQVRPDDNDDDVAMIALRTPGPPQG
ncbi:DNA-binding protein [Streptomyces agglomeratus]|uniref:protein-serine/threonine phosphatase n=1 Tax=Streptomyces agglomeratus TaxID=285458 RepID=A0A1E5PGH1_9ACTN|nr:DNA-binding protein [Streptomyces agglomeratus]OEJ37306.1 DNA-binding protein [Streptomyces agglomeratus]OEJ48312.1 DNA-binding protein [Streptomyces agglomeratus]OEJ57162.1 DNA-binding protein [Streptomyces agglomeratus]